jgi:hypothetical protein
VRARGVILRGGSAVAAVAALTLAAGCGGGQQFSGERAADYRVAVPTANFPARQSVAQRTEMRIAVRNLGDRTIPDVAATIESDSEGTAIDAFGAASTEAAQASRSRPVWIVDEGPASADTAYANTWTLGPLRPHETKTFRWSVTPVKPGRYELRYHLAGSLSGRSTLRLADGTTPNGRFTVQVSDRAAQVHVTAGGRIVSR